MLPVLNWTDKQEVAARYQRGDSAAQIARAYGCTGNVIYAALRQLQVPIRHGSEAQRAAQANEEEQSLTTCRHCGNGCDRRTGRACCPACAKRYCVTCDQPLPQSRRGGKTCGACQARARHAKRPPRLCAICGRPVGNHNPRLLCPVHTKWFCARCEVPLPPARVNRYCHACEKARKEALRARPGRRCAHCGEPEGLAKNGLCRQCRREEAEVRRWALMHLDRPCRQCGVILPKGRERAFCAPCERQRRKQRVQIRIAQGCHRCAMCHEPLPAERLTYCKGCDRMLQNWRRAWHAGNPVARQLGTVQPRRRWQQRPEEAEGVSEAGLSP
jgi:hypothetical protein